VTIILLLGRLTVCSPGKVWASSWNFVLRFSRLWRSNALCAVRLSAIICLSTGSKLAKVWWRERSKKKKNWREETSHFIQHKSKKRTHRLPKMHRLLQCLSCLFFQKNCISLRLLFLGCGIMWKVNIHCCCFTTPFNEAALRLACRSEPFNFTLSDGIVDETSGEIYASTNENKRTILLQIDRWRRRRRKKIENVYMKIL
jgi:hypothetical protein